jgi:hypothetical protein
MSHSFCNAVVLRAVLVGTIAAAPAALPAQIFYTDAKGHMVEFSSPELPPAQLLPSKRSAAELVAAFRASCIEPGFDTARTDAAVPAANGPAVRITTKVAFKPAEYDPPIEVWRTSDGAVQLVTARIGPDKGSRFRIDGPQCSLITGYTAALAQGALDTELTAALGEPANVAEAMKKGKPNKGYSPYWLVKACGQSVRVDAFSMAPHNYGEGRIQLTALSLSQQEPTQ